MVGDDMKNNAMLPHPVYAYVFCIALYYVLEAIALISYTNVSTFRMQHNAENSCANCSIQNYLWNVRVNCGLKEYIGQNV